MSIESVLQRVAALDQALANPTALLVASRAGGTAAPAAAEGAGAATEPPTASTETSFAAALQSASQSAGYGTTGLSTPTPAAIYGTTDIGTLAPTTTAPIGAPATAGVGPRIAAIAESQVGQAEQPPGSNESPAIATYRGATAGAVPGAPWCAYFASWAARQAGAPLGPQGEGLGSVAQIASWAQSTGRAIPNGPGVAPEPGDLILFGDEHVGIVKDVLPNGDIQTIEGNYENKVALNTRTSTEATSYVSMG
jgi:hypothetical protein